MEAVDMPDWQSRIIALDKVPPTQLLANPLNFRLHPRAQREALRAVIKKVGFADPIKVQNGTDKIIDGHLRAELAEEMGVPILDVVYLDVDDDQANELLAVFDRITGMAKIDNAKFDELLASLPRAQETWDMLRAANITWGAGGRINLDEDVTDPDELPTGDTITNLGDVWRLGDKHRLGVGTATNRELVMAVTQGREHDMMWTDPPYGVSYVGKTADALTIMNDSNLQLLRAMIDNVFDIVSDVLKPGSPLYVSHPAGSYQLLFGEAIIEAGWRFHQTLIWVKDAIVLGHSDYHYIHEPIYLAYTAGGEGRRGRGGAAWYGGHSKTSVFEIPRPKASRDHPTMKPVALVAEMIENSCPPGGLVYEPFAGSGQTMFACEMLGATCSMLEIDPFYADVILRRWEQQYGIAPELERNVYDGKEDLPEASPDLSGTHAST